MSGQGNLRSSRIFNPNGARLELHSQEHRPAASPRGLVPASATPPHPPPPSLPKLLSEPTFIPKRKTDRR